MMNAIKSIWKVNKTFIMEEKIIKLIKKYRETIYTLKENRDKKTKGDTYDYELDIKLCLEVIKDLENVL